MNVGWDVGCEVTLLLLVADTRDGSGYRAISPISHRAPGDLVYRPEV